MGAGALHAQGSTGKIEGRVRDQAGAPIVNAQVFVVGTSFNALTNPQGYYFINNVPARPCQSGPRSSATSRPRSKGSRSSRTRPSRSTCSSSRPRSQIQEITVVTQTQPLVPRDEVTTKQRVDGAFVDKLPVDRINQVLQLQPGVSADNAGRLRSAAAVPRSRHVRRRRAGARRDTAATEPRLARHRDQRRHQLGRRGFGHHGSRRPSSATPSRASSRSPPDRRHYHIRAHSATNPTSRSG